MTILLFVLIITLLLFAYYTYPTILMKDVMVAFRGPMDYLLSALCVITIVGGMLTIVYTV